MMRQLYSTIFGFLFLFGLMGCRSTPDVVVPLPSTPTVAPSTLVPAPPPAVATVPLPINSTIATPETYAPSETQTWTSPAGAWIATQGSLAPYERDGREWFQASLAVHNTTDGREWVLVDEERSYGFGFEAPIPYQWSADGTALYHTTSIVGDGCGLFAQSNGLYRVDLATGDQTEILPINTRFLTLSPDESRVVYLEGTSPAEVVIRVLATSAEERFGLPAPSYGLQVGEFTWTPDNQHLLFAAAHHACDPTEWRHLIYRYTPATGDLTTLVPDAVEQFHIRTVDNEAAILVDQNRITYRLDIRTGELTSIP